MRQRRRKRITRDSAIEVVREVALKPSGILVVEHDPDLQWNLARMLTVQGHRVVGTSSGDGALALLDQWPVDLVLCAEDLPGMDGIELARRIQRLLPKTPFILMASDEGNDVQMAARLAGAVACLAKPFRLETLRELIESVLALPASEPTPAE